MFNRVDGVAVTNLSRWRRAARGPVMAAVPILLVAVTITGGARAASGGPGGMTTLKVSSVPFYPNMVLALGQKVGIFAHYGLKVQLEASSDVNVTLADLHSGESQLGFATTPLVLNADEKGQNVKCVAPLGPANVAEQNFPQNAVMVAKNSTITSLKQLEGMTVGLNQLAGSNQLYLDIGVKRAGGNPANVKLATVPFADMSAALQSGTIQAAFEVQPFINAGVNAGETRVLADLDAITVPDTYDCYVATNSYINAHRSVINRFVEAQDEAILYANAHPSEARAEVGPVSGLSEAAAAGTIPPKLVLTDNLAPATMIKYQSLMIQADALNGNPLTASQVSYVAPGTPLRRLQFGKGGKFTG
jgi:NitT/TauT family transport system substrate-binding protein